MSNERDIPIVPVTTLAGLTSLSDLLVELPIAEAFSTPALNKSLLFHPRVAEESTNLLSIKDDGLTRQLIHALEQTNSDHIELKSQYSEPQAGTNINEVPQLLQSIYSLKPTVFKTGLQQNQRLLFPQIHQQIPSSSNIIQSNQIHQNSAQPNQFYLTGFNQHMWYPQQQQPVIVQQSHPVNYTQNLSLKQSPSNPSNILSQHLNQNVTNSQVNVQSMPQPIIAEVVIKQEFPNSVISHQNIDQLNNLVISTQSQQPVIQQTPSPSYQQTTSVIQQQKSSTEIHQQQQQQQHQLQQDQSQQKPQSEQTQNQTCVIQQPSAIVQNPTILQSPTIPVSPIEQQQQQTSQKLNLTHQPQLQQQKLQQQVHQQQPQQQQVQISPVPQQTQLNLQQQEHQPHLNLQQQHQPSIIMQQQLQQPSFIVQQQHQEQQHLHNQQQPQPQSPVLQLQQAKPTQPIMQNSNVIQKDISNIPSKIITNNSTLNNQTTNPTLLVNHTMDNHLQGGVIKENNLLQQQQVALQPQQQQQHPPQQQQQQKQPAPPPQQQQPLQQQQQTTLSQKPTPPPQQLPQPQSQQQHHLTSDNQNQIQPIFNLIVPNHVNPIALISEKSQHSSQSLPPPTSNAFTNSTAATTIIANTSTTSTCLAANTPTTVPMNYIKKVAVCINRMKEEHIRTFQKSLKQAFQDPEIIKAYKLENTNDIDMFTKMKAAEKRKTEDLPITLPSQPKLRRIERKNVIIKSSKEDLFKSITYQQFMKNMENELMRLEEMEQPTSNEDIDYHSDCILSKTLTQLTNDMAKLKAKGVVDAIPKNKLTLLINFAMRNVDVAANLSAGPDMDSYMDDIIDRILDAIEACLLICNIYSTAKDVKFLQEDNMDKIIRFVQYQMRETIFPSFDPVFTINRNMKKGDKQKNKKQHSGLNRSVQLLYTKIVELTKIFATLFDKCGFIDTIVLSISTLAVEPFFVDNIDTLQFACLELITTLFRKQNYVKYRSSIFSDILASIERLPSSKKNLRPYRLSNNGGNIQMITALVLQLIQCSSVLPETLIPLQNSGNRKRGSSITMTTLNHDNSITTNDNVKVDRDFFILEKYDTALSIGGNFLTTCLNKCKSRSGEIDFRPIFENIIYDLLTTVNRPEWPASELLLSLLGTMLVKYMEDKNIDQAIRVVSLEYLGIVAARLRKDTVESMCKVDTIDELIKCIKLEQLKEGDVDPKNSKTIVIDPEEERVEFLQKILLDFLAVNAQEDNLIWDFSRHYYLTLWYKDLTKRKKKIAEGQKGYATRKKQPKKRRKYKSDSDNSSQDESDISDDSDVIEIKPNKKGGAGDGATTNATDQELNLEIYRLLEERKTYLISKIKPYSDNQLQDIKTYIDYSNAHLIAQYLASKRQFSQSFDQFLKKIILVVKESSIAIRTRAMKCLTMIVEVDPSILKRHDMQMGVSQKFLDTSISVREAAVDLVGKYVLSSSELIDQYYEMLSNRILDTGVSVRKRVIKILRDICIEYPYFDKIPEICVKMIRRVNDEEGIQKLVTEVFMRMWFTPCEKNDMASIERKISQMSDVVSMAHDTGTQWLDGLLKGIFTPKEEKDLDKSLNALKKDPPKEVITACEQIADGLVNAIIKFESSDTKKVLSCATTLHLLAKVRPILLVKHAITLEPYLNLNTKYNSANILRFIGYVAEILEQVVPLMEHPSDSFLADLETHLMVLACTLNQSVISSCLSCLGAVVNRITKNYKLIRECFAKYYSSIIVQRQKLEMNSEYPVESVYQPLFRRGLYTIGQIFRFFDFKLPSVYGEGLSADESALSATICDDIFDTLLFFAKLNHTEIRRDAVIALGYFCITNFEYLTHTKLQNYYCDLLTLNEYNVDIKTIVLRNIVMYLNEADQTMSTKDKEWQTQSQVDSLCDMGDIISGMSSRIIQLYLRDVLKSSMHVDSNVRLWSMKVVQSVLRQGLVHPLQIVPYLISLSTDSRQEISHRADNHLQEIDKQYSGFVNMKAQAGIQLSYELQTLLQLHDSINGVVRGYVVKEKEEQPKALNGFLYSLLRQTKPQRRALVQSITKQFDEERTTLRQMLYLADNLAYFPYLVQDEPLFIINQIDLLISTTGTNLLQTFKENLRPIPITEENLNQPPLVDDDDDDEDKEILLGRLPDETIELQKCITSAQGCILLLVLKQHLKSSYRLTDGKITQYSPTEAAKVYEKAMQRHTVPHFNPKSILAIIHEQNIIGQQLSTNEKSELIDRYLDFKQLMLTIDKEEEDSESDKAFRSSITNTPKKNGNDLSINSTSTPHTIDGDGNADIHMNDVNVVPSIISTINPVLPKKDLNSSTNTINSHIIQSPVTPKSSTRSNITKVHHHLHQQSPQMQQQQQQQHHHHNQQTQNTRRQPARNNKRKKKTKHASSSEDDDDEYIDDDDDEYVKNNRRSTTTTTTTTTTANRRKKQKAVNRHSSDDDSDMDYT